MKRVSRLVVSHGAVAVALVVIGTTHLLVGRVTSQHGVDPTDSPVWWWGWLVLPIVAAIAGVVAPRFGGTWGWLLVLPQLGYLVFSVIRYFWFDSDEGGPLWPIGLMLLLVLGALCWTAGMIAAKCRTG